MAKTFIYSFILVIEIKLPSCSCFGAKFKKNSVAKHFLTLNFIFRYYLATRVLQLKPWFGYT